MHASSIVLSILVATSAALPHLGARGTIDAASATSLLNKIPNLTKLTSLLMRDSPTLDTKKLVEDLPTDPIGKVDAVQKLDNITDAVTADTPIANGPLAKSPLSNSLPADAIGSLRKKDESAADTAADAATGTATDTEDAAASLMALLPAKNLSQGTDLTTLIPRGTATDKVARDDTSSSSSSTSSSSATPTPTPADTGLGSLEKLTKLLGSL